MDRTTACLSHPIKLVDHGIGVVIRYRIGVDKAHVPDGLAVVEVLPVAVVGTP